MHVEARNSRVLSSLFPLPGISLIASWVVGPDFGALIFSMLGRSSGHVVETDPDML